METATKQEILDKTNAILLSTPLPYLLMSYGTRQVVGN